MYMHGLHSFLNWSETSGTCIFTQRLWPRIRDRVLDKQWKRVAVLQPARVKPRTSTARFGWGPSFKFWHCNLGSDTLEWGLLSPVDTHLLGTLTTQHNHLPRALSPNTYIAAWNVKTQILTPLNVQPIGTGKQKILRTGTFHNPAFTLNREYVLLCIPLFLLF